MNKRQSWNVTVVFLLLIFGFTAATFLKTPSSFSERENRALTQHPDLNIGDIVSGEFESKYEDFLKDQFIGRDGWIAIKTYAERAILKQDINGVYFAKDDYLIEKHAGTFSAEQAQMNIGTLSQFVSLMTQKVGADHVSVMVVPNAVEILKDKLPPFASPESESDYLANVSAALPSGTWFDTESILQKQAEEGGQVFYRTDHHWTTASAFAVFKDWAEQKGFGEVSESEYTIEDASTDFEGTVAAKIGGKVHADTLQLYKSQWDEGLELTYNQSDDVRHTVYQTSKLSTRDKYAAFYGGNYGIIQTKTGVKNGRKLLLVKDSYAHCFAPFLNRFFEEVDLVDPRYLNVSLQQLMEETGYTDVMFLMNASGFAAETSLGRLLG